MSSEEVTLRKIKDVPRDRRLRSLILECSGENSVLAKEQLFSEIAPLVTYIIDSKALEYKSEVLLDIDRDDLLQIGFLNILKNLNSYNPEICSTTWLANQIKWGIYDMLKTKIATMHQYYRQYFLRPVDEIISVFLSDYNRQPTDEEIYAELIKKKDKLNLPPDFNLTFKWFNTYRHQSLKVITMTDFAGAVEKNDHYYDERMRDISELAVSPPEIDCADHLIIKEWLDDLEPREKNVVVSKFYNDMTLEKIGLNLKSGHLTKERVRQILKQSLNKLREKYDVSTVCNFKRS